MPLLMERFKSKNGAEILDSFVLLISKVNINHNACFTIFFCTLILSTFRREPSSGNKVYQDKSPRAQRRSPGYKVQRFNKIFKALSLTVAEKKIFKHFPWKN